MATYKAEIKTVPTGSSYTVTVESGSISTAKEEIEHLYDPIYIRNLRQVNSGSSSSGSDGDGSGILALVGLGAAAWAFVSFTPWILMLVSGAAATWFGQLITGQTIEDYNERDDNKGHKRIAFVLVLAILAGGFGFVKGDELKKEFDTSSGTPAQVQSQN
jgi:hypothetical protein